MLRVIGYFPRMPYRRLVHGLALLAFVVGPAGLGNSPYAVTEEPERPRQESVALLSLILPGFGQWKEAQYEYAGVYSGIAASGLGLAALSSDSDNKVISTSRRLWLGLQMFTFSSFLSGYHSFRSTVRTRQGLGEYDFLKIEETPTDLALSPFRFDYLIRPTTLVPLALAGVLLFTIGVSSDERVRLSRVTTGDVAFTGAVSYMAGVGEEPFFRGYAMPAMNQRFQSPWLSNIATSTVFALAHVQLDAKKFFIPWPQFAFGLYAGWLSQYRDWTVSEAIFLHAWYDVLAFTSFFATEKKAVYIPLPSLNLRF